jgi:CheY-like chemotaxis protein
MAAEHARRVLVVDDNNDFRKVMRILLEGAGYGVDEAPDGKLAFKRLLESEERMVVLLDVTMPAMDGMQVLQAVAECEPLAARHAYLLVTALEGDLPRAFVDFSQGLGITIVGKPFKIDHLLGLIQQADHHLS